MKILVINAGSSSLKFQLFDMRAKRVIAKGNCDRIGLAGSFLRYSKNGTESTLEQSMPNHTVAIELVLSMLVDKKVGVLSDMSEIYAVGHRFVHSGEDFTSSVVVTPEVMKICRQNADLAPLHVPANIMGVEACRSAMPGTPMVLVFDTAFHSTMPEYAYMYALPYQSYTDWKVRRYGFHGTSHKYVSEQAAKFLGKELSDLKIITCHLGNGSSITAVDGGKSVDTSMGFTPLEGVPMGTRCGDVDAALIEYLMQKGDMSASETLDYLNKKSGMLGLSGVSSDFRDLTAAEESGNARAKLALDVFCYRVKKYIGSYAAAMDGCDVIVFTAGIGENTWQVRERVVGGLSFFGVELDREANREGERGVEREISTKNSRVKVLIIPTNEELVIARETLELVGSKQVAETEEDQVRAGA